MPGPPSRSLSQTSFQHVFWGHILNKQFCYWKASPRWKIKLFMFFTTLSKVSGCCFCLNSSSSRAAAPTLLLLAKTSTSIFAGARLLKYCSRIACSTIISPAHGSVQEENGAICIPNENIHSRSTFVEGLRALELKMWIIQIGIKRSTRER